MIREGIFAFCLVHQIREKYSVFHRKYDVSSKFFVDALNVFCFYHYHVLAVLNMLLIKYCPPNIFGWSKVQTIAEAAAELY